jgi:two-component system response regulator RegX3
MKYDCLIVDDEAALSQSACEYFNMFDVRTAWAPDAASCVDFLRDNETDLILLDINLGDSSGFDLCRQLRETTDIPILFISARTSDDDMILALNIGGDDYIPKPYSLSVLLAKVKAVLKRLRGGAAEDAYRAGRLNVDFRMGRVMVDSTDVPLKALEYRLLAYLIRNRGRVVTKDELFREVWKDTVVGDNTLNVHIRRLREKIERDPNHPELIKTVWGTGYVFEDDAT